MSELREENRRVLAVRAPGLAERIALAAVPATHQLAVTAQGAPLLVVAGVPLQHMSEPCADAARWARQAADRLAAVQATRAVVIGLVAPDLLAAEEQRDWSEVAAVLEARLAPLLEASSAEAAQLVRDV